MKKKYIVILLIVMFGLEISIDKLLFNNNETLEDKVNVPKITHKTMLSMMLETESESGEYKLETRSSWPTKEDGYIFNSTLSKCEKGSKLSWDDENNAVVMETNMSDKCYVYFDVYVEPKVLLADYIKSLYTGIQGENNLYYHDSTLENGAGDNSYRYAGSSATTNNYVCFGSDADTCPNGNLYRIIGVFDDRVRLIMADYATSALLGTDTSDYYGLYGNGSTSYYQGDSSNLTNIASYYWNYANYSASNTVTGYYNDWSYSELNKTHLNKNFLNNIGNTWANMIDTTVWKVGGFASTDVVASTLYTNEIISPSTQVTNTYESKIGLMYASDYAFAAASSSWTTTPYNYAGNDASGNKITDENWMYMGLYEWTIARSTIYSNASYRIDFSGYVGYVSLSPLAVRPVFYLNSNVTITNPNSTGSQTDPYRID